MKLLAVCALVGVAAAWVTTHNRKVAAERERLAQEERRRRAQSAARKRAHSQRPQRRGVSSGSVAAQRATGTNFHWRYLPQMRNANQRESMTKRRRCAVP